MFKGIFLVAVFGITFAAAQREGKCKLKSKAKKLTGFFFALVSISILVFIEIEIIKPFSNCSFQPL